MGLDDRDYMRARYRARAKGTRWNDRNGRVEGAWFDPVNRGQDYQQRRFGSARAQRGSLLRWLPFGLSILLTAIPAYHALKREGWFPDLRPELPFPETGAVTVNAQVHAENATSRLIVVTADANAVVQLFDPRSGRHVISVYVRKNDRTTIPVPPATYRMKVAEGQRWHGPTAFFGSSTTYETVVPLMVFTRQRGNGIDLHRRVDGTLPTRPNWRGPDSL